MVVSGSPLLILLINLINLTMMTDESYLSFYGLNHLWLSQIWLQLGNNIFSVNYFALKFLGLSQDLKMC